jgi:hypothetical protein
VTPVLDGLDEMAPPLRTMAVRRLNADLDDGRSLLLTCRTGVYEEVVQAGDVLTSAAAVELQSLPFEAAARHLQRTARPVRSPQGQRTTLWHPVIERLRSSPDDPSCTALREVMQTPLMVALLRTAYEGPDAEPAELIEGRWTERATLEAHLLDAFVPAAFRDDPRPLDSTLDALAFLARHMERRNTRELAWWELRRELPWALREWGPVLLIGVLVLGIALWAAGLYGGWTIALVTALLAPVCAGQSVFLRTGGRIALRRRATRSPGVPGEVVLAAGAVPLGVVVGVAGDLNGMDYALNPVRFQWAGGTAAALAGGLVLTTALAVLGLLGKPTPHTATLGARETGRPWARRLLGLLVVAGATAFGVVIPAQFGLSGRVDVACGALAALAAIVAVWKNPHTAGRGTSSRGQRVLPVMGRAIARGIAAGLLLGLGFGIADAAVLAGRAAAAPEFPPGGVWRTAVNGDRFLVTPDGWRHARLADGTRVALTPKAADWEIDRLPDGTVYAKTAGQTCDGTCQTVHRPVEFHLRPGHGGIRVKLSDGSFADNYDMEDILPDVTGNWLIRGTPSALFAKALWTCLLIGLSVGFLSGATAALHRWLITPTDIARLGTPWDGLRADRATAVSRGALLTAFALLSAFAIRGPGESTADTVSTSPFVLLIAAPFAVLLSAWGWFLVTRLWLCTTGRLPWRLMHFLDEAHRRGVLRQTGALYEFRHARLQERLAVGGDGSRSVQPPFIAS